jgi:hypothetical protein
MEGSATDVKFARRNAVIYIDNISPRFNNNNTSYLKDLFLTILALDEKDEQNKFEK